MIDATTPFIVAPIFQLIIGAGTSLENDDSNRLLDLFSSWGIPRKLEYVMALFLLVMIIKGLMAVVCNSVAEIVRAKISYHIRTDTFDNIMNSKWSFFLGENQGEFINTLTTQVNQLTNAISASIFCIINLLQIMLFTLIACLISFKVTLVCVAVALICAMPFFLMSRFSRRHGRTRVTAFADLSKVIQESFALSKVIIAFSNQSKQIERLKAATLDYVSADAKYRAVGIVSTELYYPIGIAALVAGLFASREMGVDFINLSMVLYCLWRLVPAITTFTSNYNLLNAMIASFENVSELEEKSLANKERSGGRVFSSLDTGVKLRNVDFTYDESVKKVLDDISIDINLSSMIALVGSSGSGKSTVVDIILGFHEPQEGSVLVDNKPLSEIDLTSYRRKIGYVPQQSVLFNDTIRSNLLWSNSDANERMLWESLEYANVDKFVRGLPEGLETIVGDRGVRLSGGQLQRLAIARAILRQPEILILDEATSSLDSESEKLIQTAIDRIAETTTSIVIAHRLSTVKNADRIYVMDSGSIVDSGTYESLMQNSDLFRAMVESQN